MSIQIKVLTRKEIEKIVKDKTSKELSFVYHELNKIRNKLIDMEDIQMVLNRGKNVK